MSAHLVFAPIYRLVAPSLHSRSSCLPAGISGIGPHQDENPFQPQAEPGKSLLGTMVFDNAGNLYGTTQQGGTFCADFHGGCGTVFQLAPQPDGAWTPQILYRFRGGSDGYLVYAGVIFDGAGNLYGTGSRR